MRCLWAAGLAAALAANPYVLNDGQSLLMSSMGIACSASLLCGTILPVSYTHLISQTPKVR